MCLTFSFQQLQDKRDLDQYLKSHTSVEQHDDADCSNIQQYYLKLDDGSTAYLAYMPIKSESSVMVCYPVDHRALGDHDEYIVPSSKIVCQASALEGRFNPAKFVKPPPPRIPATRGIGGGIKARGLASITPATLVLPQGKCIEQMDGSVIFTLKTASLVRESNQMRLLGKLCAAELMRMMDENNVDVSRIFATDRSGNVKAEALDLFLQEFIPNLRPGCDVIVCIPPFSATGKPLLKQGGSFNFAFRYPSWYEGPLPLLGLVHNIPEGQTMSNLVDVEGNFYIVSNCFSSLMLGRQEGDLTFGVNVALDADLGSYHSVEVLQHSRSLVWQKKCFEYQRSCETRILETLSDLVEKVFDSATLADTGKFYATDLKGKKFFNDAIAAVTNPSTPSFGSGAESPPKRARW